MKLLALLFVCGWTYASPAKRDVPNPCSGPITDGNNYFAYPGDDTKFIECDLAGDMNVMSCPDGLVWSEPQLACVYKFQVGAGGSGGNTNGGGTDGSGIANPCRSGGSEMFFNYPGDDSKFLQCDKWGDVFVLSCPSGLIWNPTYDVCTGPAYVPPTAAP